MSSITEPEGYLKAVLAQSWEELKKNAITHVLASLVVLVLGTVTLGLLIAPLVVGHINLVKRSRRGEEVSVGDLFSGMNKIVTSIVVALIAAVGITIGFALLVLPGVALLVLWFFVLHLIAYDDAGVGEALGGSIELVKSNFLNVLLLVVVIGVLNAIGSLAVVAALVTVPLTVIASTVGFELLRRA